MKLLRAKFINFRLLRDLELEFSNNPDKCLTVIRAANESGKTTILHGLQWALYGEAALPNKGKNFRLHPIDWDASEGKSVQITAIVEFELTTYHRQRWSGDKRETRRQYRLVRSASEEVDGQTSPLTSTVKLYELKETETNHIDAPESMINEMLPQGLREVFFMDGDSALSFIEADVALSTKRDRVRQAIRSLLSLDIIEDAIKHVRKSEAEINKKSKQIDSGSELSQIATKLEEMINKREKLESNLEDAKQQFRAFDERLNETDREIDAALQKGDKEELGRDLDQTKREIEQLDKQLAATKKEHSALFRSRSIATDLLAPLLDSAFEKLEELHDQGKLPNMTIPVLQDRLSAEICICGETLAPSSKGGEKRRTHIQKLIDNSQQADQIQETITNLYYGAKPLQSGGNVESSTWLDDYKNILEREGHLQNLRDKAGRELRNLEKQLDSLPDIDIQGLRETCRQYKKQRDKQLSNKSIYETQLEFLQREIKERDGDLGRKLREEKKGALILAERDVIRDVTEVLQGKLKQITGRELQKVSDAMNSIFLEMIGADPEQGAIIRRAEISPAFDIIVYGPKARTLNPDQDLNGASRRALTLAFILALAKVSEAKAPNIIDTPLGMTSGYVKRSILQTAIHESSQLVLLLTHDEIAGCKDIIDKAAGVVFTLTNPAHYPKMLVNDPGVPERKILRCECDHRNECNLCQRHTDVAVSLK